MQQQEPREFAPLMTAIEQVLKELGDTKSLKAPLSNRVQRLQKLYDEYAATCCFFARVVPHQQVSEEGPERSKV
jgi:hypothetical protein